MPVQETSDARQRILSFNFGVTKAWEVEDIFRVPARRAEGRSPKQANNFFSPGY